MATVLSRVLLLPVLHMRLRSGLPLHPVPPLCSMHYRRSLRDESDQREGDKSKYYIIESVAPFNVPGVLTRLKIKYGM